MNNAKHVALNDISKETTVLIDTDVDPFKGKYHILNRGIIELGYYSKNKTNSNKSKTIKQKLHKDFTRSTEI